MGENEEPATGKKLSVWFSAAQLAELKQRGLTPADVVRRGFAHEDPVTVPPDLQPAMALVARLAQALAAGARVAYPDEGPSTFPSEGV